MSTITKDLGVVTAYGYYKAGGGTMTESEFTQFMVDFGTASQTATEAAQAAAESAQESAASSADAQDSAEEASQSASTATEKATEATTAATTATTKASEASESATTATTAKTDAESARDAAAQSASEAAESAKTLTIDATLTKSRQAADAKAVGDKIDEIKSALSNMQPHVYDLTWEQGGIDSTGAEYYQNTHIRSNSIDVSDFDNVKVIYPEGYRGYICTISNGVFNRSSIAAGATVNLDITNVQSMRFDVTNGNPISVDIGEGVTVSSVYGIVTYINRLNENIADNITDLYSAISESGKFINGNNGNIGSDLDYSIRSIDCDNKTKLIINPNFTHTSLGYGFYDDSNAVKGYGKFTNPIGTYYVISVPSGATKFTFTTTLNAIPHPLLKAFEDMNDVKQQIDALKVDTSEPLANTGLVPPSFITMFKKIVHIGDSLTRGQTDTTSPTSRGADIPNYSRPVMMGRMIGNENLNLGLGGRTASNQYMNSAGYSKGWYINATGGTAYTDLFTPADFLENPGDCYIIALGTNDISEGGFTGDVSTDINDADFTQNANTSVGGYAMIIQQIKAIQPKAKIFCVTIPHSRNTNAVALRTEANQKITDIVNYFDNCYLIDLYTYAEQSANGEFATYYKNATHNNCLGYMKRAQQYIAYIDWIILNNLSDFRNVNFTGTNYDFVP